MGSDMSERGLVISGLRAGIGGPILVLSEPPVDAAEAAVEHELTPTLYSEPGLAAFERAAAALDVTFLEAAEKQPERLHLDIYRPEPRRKPPVVL